MTPRDFTCADVLAALQDARPIVRVSADTFARALRERMRFCRPEHHPVLTAIAGALSDDDDPTPTPLAA